MKSVAYGIATAAVALAIGNVTAHANLLTNGSFENYNGITPGGDGSFAAGVGATTITGWTVYTASSNGVAWIGPSNTYGIVSVDGTSGASLDLQGYGTGGPYGGVDQSIVTISGDTYALTFDLGGSPRDGGTYSIDASAGSTSQTFNYTPTPGTAVNNWVSETLDFTATGSSTLISLLGTQSGGVEEYIGLDNADVEFVSGPSATPLPATLPLFAGGLGVIGLVTRRRKRKTQAAA